MQATCLTPAQVESARSMYQPVVNHAHQEVDLSRPRVWQRDRLEHLRRAAAVRHRHADVPVHGVQGSGLELQDAQFRRPHGARRPDRERRDQCHGSEPETVRRTRREADSVSRLGRSADSVAAAASRTYQSVLETMGGAARCRTTIGCSWCPGMGHCGGGDGTSTFDMLARSSSGSRRGARRIRFPHRTRPTGRPTARARYAPIRSAPFTRGPEVRLPPPFSCANRAGNPGIGWSSNLIIGYVIDCPMGLVAPSRRSITRLRGYPIIQLRCGEMRLVFLGVLAEELVGGSSRRREMPSAWSSPNFFRQRLHRHDRLGHRAMAAALPMSAK